MHSAPRSIATAAALATALLSGCNSKPAPAPPAMQAMPVQTAAVSLSPVPTGDTYVATIKSRQSATMQPQVDGHLTRILVKSGYHVSAGQLLMTIDPLKQQAAVQQQEGTQAQKNAVYQYSQSDLDRQRKLFEAGVISKAAYDQSLQAFNNAKGDLSSAAAQTRTQRAQLSYYQVRAPFAGIVGDIPVHLGDYVSPSTPLTTLDENSQLEAYINVPTERSAQIRLGLPVDILDTQSNVLAHTTVTFLSPEVDNNLQSVLVKASVPRTSQMLRNGQLVNARITWNTAPAPVVPVLAVTRIGGQSFVFVATPRGNGFAAHQVPVTLGEPIGNIYPVRSGLNTGDKVILSGIQFLQEGAPVQPLPPGPPPPPAAR